MINQVFREGELFGFILFKANNFNANNVFNNSIYG